MFRFRRILLEIDNVLIVVLKILFAEAVNDWFAILLLLVGALMSKEGVSGKLH
jgi:hypothetical protein